MARNDKAPAPVPPRRVKLSAPFGYYDDDGVPHFWCAGYSTDRHDEIENFAARGVELETLE